MENRAVGIGLVGNDLVLSIVALALKRHGLRCRSKGADAGNDRVAVRPVVPSLEAQREMSLTSCSTRAGVVLLRDLVEIVVEAAVVVALVHRLRGARTVVGPSGSVAPGCARNAVVRHDCPAG